MLARYLAFLALPLLFGAAPIAQANGPANRATRILADLPLDLALKQVRGNGKRLFATFEDPNCTYCKRLTIDSIGITDVTIYTFLYPVLSADSREKATAIWCAADREKAWYDWMVHDIVPMPGHCDASAIDKVVGLGKKLKIRGTPTIFLADGERISGAISSMALEMAISSPKVLTFQAESEKGSMPSGSPLRKSQAADPAALRR